MSAPVTKAVIALGSNLGDRERIIVDAVRAMADTDGIEVVAVSTLSETVAITVHGADSAKPAYLNGVAIIETTLAPHALLTALNRIEADNGRDRSERWADRTLDLDIVTYGELRMDDIKLTIPHPRAAERQFVLAPWLEIDPSAVLPGVGPVAELLEVAS
jgi:2-amino-4-hydroxy-6-hydroxymethyldihydropteridine diphosphokinase